MKAKIVYLILFIFCVNLAVFPLSQAKGLDSCLSVSSQVSAKSDIFFTGYVTLMMKIALDIVSDGKTIPSPLKSSKEENKNDKTSRDWDTLWLSGGSVSENVNALGTYFSKSVVSILAASVPMTDSGSGRNGAQVFIIFMFLVSIMLVYSMARGAIDDSCYLLLSAISCQLSVKKTQLVL